MRHPTHALRHVFRDFARPLARLKANATLIAVSLLVPVVGLAALAIPPRVAQDITAPLWNAVAEPFQQVATNQILRTRREASVRPSATDERGGRRLLHEAVQASPSNPGELTGGGRGADRSESDTRDTDPAVPADDGGGESQSGTDGGASPEPTNPPAPATPRPDHGEDRAGNGSRPDDGGPRNPRQGGGSAGAGDECEEKEEDGPGPGHGRAKGNGHGPDQGNNGNGPGDHGKPRYGSGGHGTGAPNAGHPPEGHGDEGDAKNVHEPDEGVRTHGWR